MTSSTADPVTAPAHYAGDGEVDCKRAMESMHAGWIEGMLEQAELPPNAPSVWYFLTCAFKYIWRFEGKNGLEDLKKARECLDIAIGEWEGR